MRHFKSNEEKKYWKKTEEREREIEDDDEESGEGNDDEVWEEREEESDVEEEKKSVFPIIFKREKNERGKRKKWKVDNVNSSVPINGKKRRLKRAWE